MDRTANCLRCGRSLSSVSSVFLEIGPSCLTKVLENTPKRWSREEVSREVVALWDHLVGVKHQIPSRVRYHITGGRHLN